MLKVNRIQIFLPFISKVFPHWDLVCFYLKTHGGSWWNKTRKCCEYTIFSQMHLVMQQVISKSCWRHRSPHIWHIHERHGHPQTYRSGCKSHLVEQWWRKCVLRLWGDSPQEQLCLTPWPLPVHGYLCWQIRSRRTTIRSRGGARKEQFAFLAGKKSSALKLVGVWNLGLDLTSVAHRWGFCYWVHWPVKTWPLRCPFQSLLPPPTPEQRQEFSEGLTETNPGMAPQMTHLLVSLRLTAVVWLYFLFSFFFFFATLQGRGVEQPWC